MTAEPEPESFTSFLFRSGYNLTFTFGIPHAESEPEPEPESEPESEPSDYELFAEPEPPSSSLGYMPALAAIAAVIGVLIILENILILFTLVKGKPKQTSSLTYFIANLSVADIVAGMQLIWFTSIDFYMIRKKPPMYTMALCSIWLVTIAVSIIGLFSFAVYRLQIARSNMTVQHSHTAAVITIVCSWIIPIVLLVVPPLAGWNCSKCIGIETCKKKCSQILYPFTKTYAVMLAFVLMIAIVGLFCIYFWMLSTVHNKVKKVKNRSSMQRKETNMMHAVIVLLVTFTFCVLPVAVILVIDYTQTEYDEDLFAVFQFATVWSFINSVCNPFIYVWRLPSMRAAMWKALGKRRKLNDFSTRKTYSKEQSKNIRSKSVASIKSFSDTDSKVDYRKKSVETIMLSKIS